MTPLSRESVARCVSRSGVWLQLVQSVSQGEQHRAQLRQDVHRPRGEQRHVSFPFIPCCKILVLPLHHYTGGIFLI